MMQGTQLSNNISVLKKIQKLALSMRVNWRFSTVAFDEMTNFNFYWKNII